MRSDNRDGLESDVELAHFCDRLVVVRDFEQLVNPISGHQRGLELERVRRAILVQPTAVAAS